MSSRCNSDLFCGLSPGLPLSPAICLLNELVEPKEPKGFGQPQGGAAEELLGRAALKHGPRGETSLGSSNEQQ